MLEDTESQLLTLDMKYTKKNFKFFITEIIYLTFAACNYFISTNLMPLGKQS